MIKYNVENKEKNIKIEKMQEIKSQRYCDICNKLISQDCYNHFPNINGSFEEFDNKRITEYELNPRISVPIIGILEQSYNYGDSGGENGECFDICEDCYFSKIKPLLFKEFNLKPRTVQYDW